MKTRRVFLLAVPAVLLGLSALVGAARLADDEHKEDKDAIAKSGEDFVAAFDKGDARALAAFWAPDGDHTDQSGHTVKGREAIERGFEQLFAENKGLRLHIDSESLKFITPDVAVEDGVSEVIPADGQPPSRTRYTIVHVKKDGKWLVSSVRNAPVTPPSNAEHLRGLEWAVGDWAGEREKGEMEHLSVAPTANENFLIATFMTTAHDAPVAGATQWIGWDPRAKKVRSWIFDDTGGFGDGTWTEDGKKWTIKATMVLRDGKEASATWVVGRVDDDTITLESKDRTADGHRLPDRKEIKLKRVK
jgi:uncharacterized protein (TIGR02246 family)